MKKIFFALIFLSIAIMTSSQQKEGKVIYARIMQMQIQINDNDPGLQMLPKTLTDKFELTFGNNQSIWKHVDEEENDEVNGNGMQLKMIAPGQNDVVFYDFAKARKVEQRELMDRKFIITDTIHKLDWKVSDETQTLLSHVCRKATAQHIGKRTQMTIDNGKMERKEMPDTSNMIAWFATDIAVPAGPEVQGQLPGLILALEINDGRAVYKAIELSAKADIANIKEPTKGKKITSEEYVKETAKMMHEMQKNNQGSGNKVIHIN